MDGVPHLEALYFLFKPYPSGQDPEDGLGAVGGGGGTGRDGTGHRWIPHPSQHGPNRINHHLLLFTINLIASSALLRMGGHTWLLGQRL